MTVFRSLRPIFVLGLALAVAGLMAGAGASEAHTETQRSGDLPLAVAWSEVADGALASNPAMPEECYVCSSDAEFCINDDWPQECLGDCTLYECTWDCGTTCDEWEDEATTNWCAEFDRTGVGGCVHCISHENPECGDDPEPELGSMGGSITLAEMTQNAAFRSGCRTGFRGMVANRIQAD